MQFSERELLADHRGSGGVFTMPLAVYRNNKHTNLAQWPIIVEQGHETWGTCTPWLSQFFDDNNNKNNIKIEPQQQHQSAIHQLIQQHHKHHSTTAWIATTTNAFFGKLLQLDNSCCCCILISSILNKLHNKRLYFGKLLTAPSTTKTLHRVWWRWRTPGFWESRADKYYTTGWCLSRQFGAPPKRNHIQ